MSRFSELAIDQMNNDKQGVSEWDLFLRFDVILDYLIAEKKKKE